MRKRLSLLYALIVLAIGAHAYSFESGGIYYNITSSTNMTVEVTYGKNYGAYVDNIYTIPNQVTYNAKTYYVTAIGSHAFTSCTALGTVDLSQAKHLSSIGEYAFSGCNGMSRITIPEHVTTIGNYAFSGCMTLSILEIEDSKNTLSLGYGSSKGSNYGLFADCNLYTFYWGRPLSYNTSYGKSPIANQSHVKNITIGPNVTTLSAYMFYGNEVLNTIELPSTVISLGSHAFDGFRGLTSFTIPEQITAISDYAFANCPGLTSFSIPSQVKSIGNYAFSGCPGLTSFTIPGTVTNVGNRAFEKCKNITSLKFEPGTEVLALGFTNYYDSGSANTNNKGLFIDCPLEIVELNRKLSYKAGSDYGYSPFANISTLKRFTIGEQLTSVYNYIFYGDKYLSEVNLAETITAIGNYSFADCVSLTSLQIPATVTSIGDYAFRGCTGFTKFLWGTGVETVGAYAFSGCTSLTTLNIPGHVKSIGNRAFQNCKNITTMKFEPGTEVLALGFTNYYDSGSANSNNRGLFIDCPLESVELNRNLSYKAGPDYGYSPFANIKTLTTVTTEASRLGNYLFYGDNQLSSVSMTDGVTAIGNYTFSGCSAIAHLSLSNNLETIGDYAFNGCSLLTGLIFHPALKNIGNYAFRGCTAFNNMTFEEGEETLTLGKGASEGEKFPLFKDCPLTSVFIGRNLIYDYRPLAYHPTLKEVRIGNPVTRIGDNYLFIGDTKLETVVFNRNCQLQSLGKYTFAQCTKLESIELPETVTTFDEGAFQGCTALTDCTLPTSLTTISDYAMQDCPGITTLNLPEGLKSIGAYAFSGCTGVTSLNVPAATTRIGNYAFSGCTGITELTFEDDAETLALGFGASKGKAYGLFNDCPLETLYVGRTLSYTGNSANGYSPFYGLMTLTEATIGTQVKSLDYCILYGTGITELYIPSSVRTLQSSFVNNCPNLKRVIILGATPPTIDNKNTLLYNSAEGSKFYVFFPDKYKAATTWKNYADRIDPICTFTDDFVYTGRSHTLDYETDFPIVLSNLETETDAGSYIKHVEVGYRTNGYMMEDVFNYDYIIKAANVDVTVENVERLYGDKNPEFDITLTGMVDGEDASVLESDVVATTKATVTSGVGTYDITLSGAKGKNYTFTYHTGTLTVQKAPLIISTDDVTIAKGEKIPAFSIHYDGFRNNETEKVLTRKPTATTTATSASPAGTYPITISGAEAKNYEPQYEEGVLTISDEFDGIVDAQTSPSDNQQSIYSPSGVKLSKIRNGLNIIGGKKVFVKKKR